MLTGANCIYICWCRIYKFF